MTVAAGLHFSSADGIAAWARSLRSNCGRDTAPCPTVLMFCRDTGCGLAIWGHG